MDWLSRISVRAKLLLLLLAFSTGMVGVALAGWVALSRTVATAQSLVETEVTSVRTLGEIRSGVGNMRRFEKDMFLNLADEEDLERYRLNWKKQADGLRSSLTAIEGNLDEQERASLQTMRTGIANYEKVVESILVGISRGEVNDPWRANQLLEPSKGDIRAADGALADIAESVNQRVDRAAEAMEELRRQTLVWLVAGASAALMVSLVLGYVISHRISGPLQHAVLALDRVASGDLSQPLTHHGQDEPARLFAGMAAMQTSLSAIVREIRGSIQSIHGASGEIAAGNTDLSRRTEQAAASLEETSASMEEINATVTQTADMARQASELVSRTTQTALQGGDVMQQVVTAMNQISRSSHKIQDIIGVIDGIAFQTNILALNAAVEAARAGEQGRGFAVVAAEVRTLAQRSAHAAKEIKGLIGSSVDEVDVGARLVNHAGLTMNEIVQSVGQVSSLVIGISSSSEEQRGGIGQINIAIAQLDQVTQQNAALVEESAAAAESLRTQAQRLAERVAVFRLAQA
jgi:methyl-accepting chemotaxis protein